MPIEVKKKILRIDFNSINVRTGIRITTKEEREQIEKSNQQQKREQEQEHEFK